MLDFARKFYSLDVQAKEVYTQQNRGKIVTFEGVVVETWNKKVVVYAGEGYNGESWADLTMEPKRFSMLPFTFIAQSDYTFVHFPQGTRVKFKGRLHVFGSFTFGSHWKIRDVELLEAGEVE